jgi:CheY-like chemotaxis protein
MHHRSHDREALDRSNEEPDSTAGSGSFVPDPDELRVRIHEAANWLAVLHGHLDLLTTCGGTADVRLESARRSLQAAERALAGRAADARSAELRELVHDLVEDARALCPRARIRSELPRSVCWVRTRTDALRDVLLNLIRNADEAMAADGAGEIRVVVQVADDGSATVAVEDDGPGMDDEVRRRCFEAGFSTKSGGRGFGLARAAMLARELGSELELSTRPGRGSRFTLRLEGADAAPETPASDAVRTVPPRVLLVDDDPEVRLVLAEMLDASGVEHVVPAATPDDARAAFAAGSFDVVLLDRQLGEVLGDVLANEIRQLDPAVGIVLLTGDPVTRDPTPRRAFDRLVTKPLGLDALRTCLHETYELTRRRRNSGTMRGGA